jgi:hypothetical protein
MMNNQKKYQSRSGPTVLPAPVGRSKERLKVYRLKNVEETTKEYERPYFGPSHVEDGAEDVLKLKPRYQSIGCQLIRDPIPQVELPTERRKKELRKELADSEHLLILDYRFGDVVWRIRFVNPGRQRDRAIEQFWKQVYEDYQLEDGDSLQLRSFIFNDFLHALDELHELEASPCRVDTSLWGDLWNPRRHRSSADTDGPSSRGSSNVGSGSVAGLGLTSTRVTRDHPLRT